jgi:hypothetical protein
MSPAEKHLLQSHHVLLLLALISAVARGPSVYGSGLSEHTGTTRGSSTTHSPRRVSGVCTAMVGVVLRLSGC